MRHHRRRTLLVSAACSAILAGAALPASASSPASAASPQRRALPNSHADWAVPAAEVTKAPAAKPIRARVYLAGKNPAALNAAVAAVSTPGSPSYRHYLTPAQFRARYGPAAAAVKMVTSWLKRAGLKVSAPKQNGRYVEVTGSVKSAERAFGSGLSIYRYKGGTYQAPARTLSVPAAVSTDVLTVTGLDEAPARMSPNTDVGLERSQSQALAARQRAAVVFPPGFRNAKPCSLYYGQLDGTLEGDFTTPLVPFMGKTRPYAVCGYRPIQLRAAYAAPDSLTGKGVTVAIIDAYLSPTLAADANRYATNSGVPTFTAGQLSIKVPAGGYTNQADCDAAGWSGEQSLDVEAVHGFAPDAKIIYTAGRSCFPQDLFDAEASVVDANQASIVSLSYGSVEEAESTGAAAAETALFKQAAMQGIGFYIASGDHGDELLNTGLKQVDSSASNPYVTAVGGSSIGIGPAGDYQFESGWGTDRYLQSANKKRWVFSDFTSGGGGGFSDLFNRPGYQKGVIPAGSPAGRALPDIAMDADPTTGMKVGLTQEFPDGTYYDEYRVGGTSLSTPLFAAVQALTSQAQKARLGFANPRIYALAKKATPSKSAFHDITNASDGTANMRPDFADSISAESGIVYSIRTFDDDTSLATHKGWDDVTGVGSPSPAYYAATGH